MPVGIHRDLDGRVPKQRLDPLWVDIVCDEQGRIGVAKVMKPHFTQTGPSKRLIEGPSYVLIREAAFIREH